MNPKDNNIIEPTNKERGYHTGWQAYHSGMALNSNAYHPQDELELYEGFIDGWAFAQLEDTFEDNEIRCPDIMAVEVFASVVKAGAFVDTDGMGYYGSATSESTTQATPSHIANNGLKIGYTHIWWYNK